MNQRWAWLWGTFISPPLSSAGVLEMDHLAAYYERAHYGYGLLVGRVFLGVVVSRSLDRPVSAPRSSLT
jgi:hypothetical protein